MTAWQFVYWFVLDEVLHPYRTSRRGSGSGSGGSGSGSGGGSGGSGSGSGSGSGGVVVTVVCVFGMCYNVIYTLWVKHILVW